MTQPEEYDTPPDWPDAAKEAFSRMYRHTVAHQKVFTHPDMGEMPDYMWETLCWNMAWIAAGCAIKSKPFMHMNEDGHVIAVEATKEQMQ